MAIYFFISGLFSFLAFGMPIYLTESYEFNNGASGLTDFYFDKYYRNSNLELQSYVLAATNVSNGVGIELVGNFTYVVDGDTLDINGIRIRLTLVDTPERGQPGFKEAKEFVSSLCLGKKGQLDVDDGQRRGDRYGREIGVVYCNGVNINEKLMDEHLARILTDYCEISEFSKENWAASCNLRKAIK